VEDGVDWTDCPIIEQISGKMSGAPVLRHSRVRPQDILADAELGAEWIAEAHSLPVDDVRQVLAFYAVRSDELPLEYIPPEEIAELGVNEIDWTGCSLIERTQERLSGAPVIRHTPVRAVDRLANREAGVDALASSYGLPTETVWSVLRYYDEQTRHFAPAV
jgi:uncharacterized protein (DUF433 family)